jgi:hypothetical protein
MKTIFNPIIIFILIFANLVIPILITATFLFPSENYSADDDMIGLIFGIAFGVFLLILTLAKTIFYRIENGKLISKNIFQEKVYQLSDIERIEFTKPFQSKSIPANLAKPKGWSIYYAFSAIDITETFIHFKNGSKIDFRNMIYSNTSEFIDVLSKSSGVK